MRSSCSTRRLGAARSASRSASPSISTANTLTRSARCGNSTARYRTRTRSRRRSDAWRGAALRHGVERAATRSTPLAGARGLRGTCEQQLAFALVARQRGGAFELRAGFGVAAELREEVAAHAREQVVLRERGIG